MKLGMDYLGYDNYNITYSNLTMPINDVIIQSQFGTVVLIPITRDKMTRFY